MLEDARRGARRWPRPSGPASPRSRRGSRAVTLPSPSPSTAKLLQLASDAQRAADPQLGLGHAAAEVGLEPGDRGQRPDALLAEVVAAGGRLEGLR